MLKRKQATVGSEQVLEFHGAENTEVKPFHRQYVPAFSGHTVPADSGQPGMQLLTQA